MKDLILLQHLTATLGAIGGVLVVLGFVFSYQATSGSLGVKQWLKLQFAESIHA